MNKAELEKRIAHAKVGVEMYSQQRDIYLCDIKALETQLAELTKAKTGRMKIGDAVTRGMEIFYINDSGFVQVFVCGMGMDRDNFGREFYDRSSAELFALREATEFKVWCEFGDDVRVVYSGFMPCEYYREIQYVRTNLFQPEEINNFLDTLSEEELNSIRGK